MIDAAGAIYVIGGRSSFVNGTYTVLTYFSDVWMSTDGADRTRSSRRLVGGAERVLKVCQGGTKRALRGTQTVLLGTASANEAVSKGTRATQGVPRDSLGVRGWYFRTKFRQPLCARAAWAELSFRN